MTSIVILNLFSFRQLTDCKSAKISVYLELSLLPGLLMHQYEPMTFVAIL
jgi:hypothetical protein